MAAHLKMNLHLSYIKLYGNLVEVLYLTDH